MRAARRSAPSSAPLVALPTPHILDVAGCIDVLQRLVFDELFTKAQARYWRLAIFPRVCVETRILQPAAGTDDLPSELAKLAGVNRSFHFEFCNVMGPNVKLGEPLQEHHLLLRQLVPPNGTYPVDDRPTSSGGTGLLLLFASPDEFDRRARLRMDRSPVNRTQVRSTGLKSDRSDSSPVNRTASIFMASQSERDRDDLAVESRSLLSSSPPDPSLPPPPPHGSARTHAAVAPMAPGLATASPGVVRTSLREGVSRQQSTAKSQDANAAREGQKSRGSAARAPAPRASDEEMHVVRAVLKCWSDLFNREVDDSFSAVWVGTLLEQLRTGRSGHELLRVIGGARKNPWNGDYPHRTNIPALFKSEQAIAESSSFCASGFLAHLCRRYGVTPPPRPKNAPTGRLGANDQGTADGLDSTEQVTHTTVEEFARRLNNFDVSSGASVPRPGGRKGNTS